MSTLVEILKDPQTLRRVAADAADLIDREVRGKAGISGIALKAGYKTVKTMRPTMVEDAVAHLLPDFAGRLDEHLVKGREQGDVRVYFRRHADPIAHALLGVTDGKASRAKNAVLKKVYDGLRPTAHRHTVEAVPALADLILRHVK